MTNLRAFDLEAAKRGEPVITRTGTPVRIICFDAKSDYYPIISLIDKDETGCNEIPTSFSLRGEELIDEISDNDLFMAPKTKTYWLNIWRDRQTKVLTYSTYLYDNEQEAIDSGIEKMKHDTTHILLRTISIEIEQ